MRNIILAVFVILLMDACKKDPMLPESATVKFTLDYEIDNEKFHFDSIRYINDAGNQYSITRLEYYVSKITFHNSTGENFFSEEVFYINANEKKAMMFDSIPSGIYTGVSFYIGIPEDKNKTGYLPSTFENINMAWPDPMGGGYHFMKFEGHFRDSAKTSGYAVHLGTNAMLVKVHLDYNFELKYSNHHWQLVMNLNEWFRNPHVYDLAKDGNYTMHKKDLMTKITANGSSVYRIGMKYQ
jgi:hypothetical protein